MSRIRFSNKNSGSDVTGSPAEKPDVSRKPYYMTQSEIAALRQAAQMSSAAMLKILAEKTKN